MRHDQAGIPMAMDRELRFIRSLLPVFWLLVGVAVPLMAGPPPGAQAEPGGSAPRQGPLTPQVARDGWKDCAFNDVSIACVDQALPQGGLRLLWKDGLRMNYSELPPRKPGDPLYLRDQLGGVWQRQVLAQGNTVLTNISNGARIFIPLRFPCKPPLKGEVGYCRD
jgi:hypothetical protein